MMLYDDAYSAYWDLKNGKTNSEDRDTIVRFILSDPSYAFYFLSEKLYQSESERLRAKWKILRDADRVTWLLSKCPSELTEDERQIAFEIALEEPSTVLELFNLKLIPIENIFKRYEMLEALLPHFNSFERAIQYKNDVITIEEKMFLLERAKGNNEILSDFLRWTRKCNFRDEEEVLLREDVKEARLLAVHNLLLRDYELLYSLAVNEILNDNEKEILYIEKGKELLKANRRSFEHHRDFMETFAGLTSIKEQEHFARKFNNPKRKLEIRSIISSNKFKFQEPVIEILQGYLLADKLASI